MHYAVSHMRRTARDDLNLVIEDGSNGPDLWVEGRLGPVGGVCDTLTSLDPTTPKARDAAAWLERQSGMPHRRVLAELGRAWVGEIAREAVAA